MILRLLLCLVSVCPFFFFFFSPYLFSSPTSVMTTIGAAVGFRCFVDRAPLSHLDILLWVCVQRFAVDWDRTRQWEEVGGRQWKKSFWVVWLLRSGRGKYLECRLNGCAGEAPRCGEGTLKSTFFPFLSESRSLTVRCVCACVRAFLRNIAEGKWEWYLFWAFVFFVATPLFLLPVTVSFVPQPTPQLYHIVSYNHTKWD